MTSIPYTFSDTKELKMTIGFCKYADLMRKEDIRKGFVMNYLFVGRRGLGTKTLVNSIFSSEIIPNDRPNSIESHAAALTEDNITLKISVSTCHIFDKEKLKEYIYQKNKQFYENKQEKNIQIDCRIHACIFLLPADELKDEELECMKILSQETNLIPIMAKSDIYTENEREEKRENYKKLLEKEQIEYFLPPIFSNSEKESSYQKSEIKEKMPLALIASEKMIKRDNQFLRIREYNWGTIYITKEHTNDFNLLRQILVSQNSMDLVYLVDSIFYDKFRYNYSKKPQKKEMILEKLKNLRLEVEKIEKIKKMNSKKAEKSETEESEKSETTGSEKSEITENEKSEITENEKSETAESEKSEITKSEKSEITENEKSETAESEKSETIQSEKSETAESEKSEITKSEKSEILELKESEKEDKK